MPYFLVRKLEIWEQPIMIEAATPEEAKAKVKDGYGDQHVDGDYKKDVSERDWLVEKSQ